MSGTKIFTSVIAAQLQDKLLVDNVLAQLQPLSGTETPVFAQLTLSDQTVFHAQLQDSGITIKVNVSAHKTEFGTDKIAFVLQDFMESTVNHAQLQEDG